MGVNEQTIMRAVHGIEVLLHAMDIRNRLAVTPKLILEFSEPPVMYDFECQLKQALTSSLLLRTPIGTDKVELQIGGVIIECKCRSLAIGPGGRVRGYNNMNFIHLDTTPDRPSDGEDG